MHALAVQLAPLLAAEKSKVPFYVAGGLLVAWAFAVSLGVGMRRTDFPANLGGQRAVMAVSAVLMLAAVSTAVITSDVPAKGKVPPTHTQATAPVPVAPAPASGGAGEGR